MALFRPGSDLTSLIHDEAFLCGRPRYSSRVPAMSFTSVAGRRT
jgi:hypothetical protein